MLAPGYVARRRAPSLTFAVLAMLALAVFPGCQLPLGWQAFCDPELTYEGIGLTMMEPYQPGKIPVVFVHGLLSQPDIWNAMTAALKADPEISDRYQIWLYGYSTGPTYLTSAAQFRRELVTTLGRIDPRGADAALWGTVLVGHSMGGLLSKLQVTHSDRTLWRAVAQIPFDRFEADESLREQIGRALFFRPLPFVKRVVFIATPHHGSDWSQNVFGRTASNLVKFPEDLRTGFERIVQWNSQGLTKYAPQEPPTSIDHLSPDSEILQATASLRFAPWVKLHSIIGDYPRLLRLTRSDDIVDVDSASISPVESERIVSATHVTIHGHEESIAEVKRILKEHWLYHWRQIQP